VRGGKGFRAPKRPALEDRYLVEGTVRRRVRGSQKIQRSAWVGGRPIAREKGGPGGPHGGRDAAKWQQKLVAWEVERRKGPPMGGEFVKIGTRGSRRTEIRGPC